MKYIRLLWISLLLGLTACIGRATPGSLPPPATPTLVAPATATPTLRPDQLVPGAALSARQVLVQQLQRRLPLDNFHFAHIEAVTWPDACLGIALPEQMCAEVLTPGYRVVLEVEGDLYTFHTDAEGGVVRLAAAPAFSVPDAAIVWSRWEEGRCLTATFGGEIVAFGDCGGVQMPGRYVTPQRAAAFTHFVATYADFEAETAEGYVRLNGQGAAIATLAEQRMIGFWAHQAYCEASCGRTGAAYGWAFTWERQGGIAGFCDRLDVRLTGEAYASSCHTDADQTEVARLNAAQLEQLYALWDTLASFDYVHTDPATADAMTIIIRFGGQGKEAYTAEDIQALESIATALFVAAQP